MKKTAFKITSLLLSIVLLFSVMPMSAAAEGKISSCGDDCEFYPTIIVPGLGQSSVCVADENGSFVLDDEGNKISAFPAYVQTDKIVMKALFPVITSLITQTDAGLSDALAEIVAMCFGINGTDLNGNPSGTTITEVYPSYAECNEEQLADINSHIPFERYPTDLPEDHIYYFMYNSFGNHIDMTKDLYDFIHQVMEETGHDKVNLVPLSQGATLTSALYEYYPDSMDLIHKVLYIVPALDGSRIIGDIFTDRIAFLDKEYLYNGFLEEMGLLDSKTAHLIEVLMRILPDEVLMTAANAAIDTLVSDIMTRCTSMWALCPSADYEEAAAKYLSSPEMAEIKAQTDKYHQAQVNSRANIQKLVDKGVQVFCVAEYDINLINVGENWNAQNGDYIIQLDSTSMGATSAKVGETLHEDYVQQNTHCTNPDHNHISPDRVVDASTGLLPDTTFYFKNQRHDLTQHNDVILKIAMELIAHDDITDVYSSPEFPQFLNGRDAREYWLVMDAAEKMLAENALPESIGSAFNLLMSNARDKFNNNLLTGEEVNQSLVQIRNILEGLGYLEPTEEKAEDSGIFEKISHWLYENYGTNGFSEIPSIAVMDLIGKIKK